MGLLSKIGVTLTLVFSSVLNTNTALAHHEQYKVVLFVPRADAFWLAVSDFMQAVCEDLVVECLINDSNDDHREMRKQIEQAGSGADKVDAVIFQSLKKNGGQFIKTAEEVKVNAFLINAGLEKQEYEVMGKPREIYKYWLGELLPDDRKAGFELANALIDAAKVQGNMVDGKVHMFGITGITSDWASIERTAGLREAVSLRDDVILHQIVPGEDWGVENARGKFLWLMKRYPQTSVVWGANDARALGALQGAEQLGLSPGKDIFIGGVDWSSQGLGKVRDGKFAVDLGGHMMEAGWAVIMLYDYFHGIDFSSEGLEMKSDMTSVTIKNVDGVLECFVDRNWERVDFSQFSKHLNPELKKYTFTLEALIDHLPD